ncbi:MAG: tRNA uridine-5-carboxymethylaminomethyl(34) synthesis GTPase MnmE [Bacteroidales bacterium]|nr:tRNA uridine-5-carboxymethylaminomethyl(34) synthesis GTPase MnmE [Bacteroidales bacterium]
MNKPGPDTMNNDTICALSTPSGTGAIAVVRISGKESLAIARGLFHPANKQLSFETMESHRQYYGEIRDDGKVLDEVLLCYFKAPHSYTGEDSVEISCHGSEYVQRRLVELLLANGCRLAEPGEYTMRAFLNGKMDLSQAEAVADLIASESKTAHRLAINQMRGGFSKKIAELRAQLLDFVSLIELELDFSEEDVEFADRTKLYQLLTELKQELAGLINSFRYGNVIKQGIPVAIIGKPNVGKSTLLNALLNEEKAIVSDIPGTTRDSIEDTIVIEGYRFRFVDTAGLRRSEDHIESLGIERTYEKIRQAAIILYICDMGSADPESLEDVLNEFRNYIQDKDKHFILVGNKIDLLAEAPAHLQEILELETVFVSAKRKENIHLLAETLVSKVKEYSLSDQVVVSSSRHFEALNKAFEAIEQVEEGFKQDLPTDLIATDLRQALHHLGSITGEVTTDEILGNIFGKFCIGK